MTRGKHIFTHLYLIPAILGTLISPMTMSAERPPEPRPLVMESYWCDTEAAFDLDDEDFHFFSSEEFNAEAPDDEEFIDNRQDTPVPFVHLTTPSIYAYPYSRNLSIPDWHHLWINTGVLTGAFVSTLVVLECLPEDATNWNRAEIRNVPPFTRWYNNVFKKGPHWDADSPIFNYLLHPYAGAVYFMSARSCGFNFWQSFLYCSIISNVCWEFGVEAFMEAPSVQDLIITPCVGSVIGEVFYKTKRKLVENNYCLFGSPALGNILAVLIDPVNEVIGLISGNPAREVAKQLHSKGIDLALSPMYSHGYTGFTFRATF